MDFAEEVESLARHSEVTRILQQLCELTDMGFAAVARVTEDRWIACQVLDRIGFGLEPGGELEVKTTICDEIRESGRPVLIDSVADLPSWRVHPTPVLYGFQSYVSLPLFRADGSFFGTLCAIDPEPREINTTKVRRTLQVLAGEAMAILDREL